MKIPFEAVTHQHVLISGSLKVWTAALEGEEGQCGNCQWSRGCLNEWL